MNVYRYLRNHRSMICVYPTDARAHEAFLESHRLLPPDLKDVEFIYKQRSIVRTNPSSRVPTAIIFVSYSHDPQTYRGMAAPVELIDPFSFMSHQQRERWKEFQLIQERHRHAG